MFETVEDTEFDDDDFSGKYVTSFADLTDDDLDPDPDEEGTDTVHDPIKTHLVSLTPHEVQYATATPPPVRIVQHHRDIKRGSKGRT